MGDGTKIQWTEATWNPVRGCSRVSKGCEHCYAEQVARRFSGPGQPYEGLVRLDENGKAKAQWNGAVRMVHEHLADPLRWTKPRLVFVNSMSDLFHEGLAFEQIDRVFAAMLLAPQHSYQILTKRPERLAEYLGAQRFGEINEAARDIMEERRNGDALVAVLPTQRHGMVPFPRLPWWIGVSVEDQTTADARIPALLTARSSPLFGDVAWVSYEPALGPVDFRQLRPRSTTGGYYDALAGAYYWQGAHDAQRLDWIVVGGESGPGARPFDLAWARSTLSACKEAGTACFVKQLGARPVLRSRWDVSERRWHELDANGWTEHDGPPTLADRKGGDMDEWPEDLRVRQFPEIG